MSDPFWGPDAFAAARALFEEQIRQAVIGGPPAEPQDPVQELLAVISEPCGLDSAALDKLAPYGTAAPGKCRECRYGTVWTHLGPAAGLCLYCGILASGPYPADDPRSRRCAHTRGRVALYYALACAVWLMVTANIAIGALILAGVIR